MSPSSQDPRLPDDLLGRLRRSPAPELRSLVEVYGRFFTLPEVRQLLLNPFVDGETLDELSTIRHLTRSRPVQAAIARHPRTPEPVAMRFVPHLFWRELLEISVDLRIRAAVRRAAERYMLERLPRLTAGEKISLARRAAPSTLGPLIHEGDLKVLTAALNNPRMTEAALMPLLRDPRTSSRSLALVGAHARWQTRYEVCVALCRNPQTPFRDIRRMLPSLSRDDLEGVAMVSAHSGLVLQWVTEERVKKSPRVESEHDEEAISWDLEAEARRVGPILESTAEDTTD